MAADEARGAAMKGVAVSLNGLVHNRLEENCLRPKVTAKLFYFQMDTV